MKTNAFALAFVPEKKVRDLPSRSFTTIALETALISLGITKHNIQIVSKVTAFILERIMRAI